MDRPERPAGRALKHASDHVALLANRTTIGCTSRLASACLSTRRGRGKWISASLNPPGHPTTRPFGFAALLGLAGAGRTRLCEPQTGCRPISCQPCATRPRKRGLGPCMLHVGLTRLSTACRGCGACDVLRRPSLPGCPCTITVLVSPNRQTATFRFYLSRVTACPLPRPPLL